MTLSNVTMRAVQQNHWGGPDQLNLVEIPRPAVLPTEILVRVRAAGINPVDVFTREGKAYNRALQLPHVPGWDVSGTVEAVGYGVTRFKVGDDVFGMPWFPREAGAYAEFVSAPARHFAYKPLSISHEEAAALPLAGLTAWQMIFELAALQAGQRILINGGAGGVGHLAIQIAKAAGAYVIATASAAKHGFVLRLGADEAIDYATTDIPATVRDIDVVIDLVGGDICIPLLRCLRPSGLLISAQAAWAPGLIEEATLLGVRATWYLVEPDAAGLEALTALIDTGQLRVHVDRTFPLADAREAQAHVASRRAIGKVVLVP